jgi:hypothetical protein
VGTGWAITVPPDVGSEIRGSTASVEICPAALTNSTSLAAASATANPPL